MDMLKLSDDVGGKRAMNRIRNREWFPDDRYIEGNIGIHPQCAGIATADTTMGSDPYMIYTVAAGVKVLPLFFFNEVNRKACNVLIFGPLTAKMPKFRSQGFESKAVYVTLPGAWSVSKALSKAVGFDDLPMDATEMLAYSGPILGRATETYEDVRQRVRDVYDNPPWNFGRNKKRVKIADPDRRAPRFSKKRTLTDYPGMFAARNPTEGLVDGLKELGKLLIADDIVYNVN